MNVAQVSNLLYRRFPIGRAVASAAALETAKRLRVGNPRYSRFGNLRYGAVATLNKYGSRQNLHAGSVRHVAAFQAAGWRGFQAPRSFGAPRRKSAVETPTRAANICVMKLLYAFAAWIAMGTVLGAGILMAVKGSPWLLIAGLIGFVIAVGKIGCLPH